jgi:hypothetical protein
LEGLIFWTGVLFSADLAGVGEAFIFTLLALPQLLIKNVNDIIAKIK